MKHALHALLNALVFHAGPPGRAGFDECAEARSAYERGDYVTALRLLEPLAGGGNAEAQYGLGIHYDNGKGVPRNVAEAVTWYRRAAEQGHVEAQANLGASYYLGSGAPQDHAQALHWFRLAAGQGHAGAQSNLGVAYSEGKGVARDPAEAMKWFRLSAEQGNASGQNHLGIAYLNGNGVLQDYAEALKWFRLAAEQGLASGQSNVGRRYHLGEGVQQDYAAAAKWYRLSAEQGDSDAQHGLGYLCSQGLGVPQDPAEAVKWFRLAAEQGDTEAQHSLGYLYETAEGVARDFDEAARWYRLAAAKGHPKARLALGHLHATGRIAPVVRDIPAAVVSTAAEDSQGVDERPTEIVHWPAVTRADKVAPAEWVQPVWRRAAENDWAKVFDRLAGVSEYVNACCPFNDAQNTFLHLAASQGAPAQVVRRLIELGGWRALRNASHESPFDLAKAKGHSHLLGLLEPQYKRQVPLAALMKIQETFHELIRWRAGAQVEQYALRLPQLEPMLEFEKTAFWFEVIGWAGGFNYRLKIEADGPKLISDSRVRPAGGSGMSHEISPTGIKLVSEYWG